MPPWKKCRKVARGLRPSSRSPARVTWPHAPSTIWSASLEWCLRRVLCQPRLLRLTTASSLNPSLQITQWPSLLSSPTRCLWRRPECSRTPYPTLSCDMSFYFLSSLSVFFLFFLWPLATAFWPCVLCNQTLLSSSNILTYNFFTRSRKKNLAAKSRIWKDVPVLVVTHLLSLACQNVFSVGLFSLIVAEQTYACSWSMTSDMCYVMTEDKTAYAAGILCLFPHFT